MKKLINTSFFLSNLSNINCIIINKDSKIYINHLEFCNVKDNLNLNIVENEEIKFNDFLNLFNNDTYSTYEISGKKVNIKLSELKFDKILVDIERFSGYFNIEKNGTIPSMSENNLKKPIGMSYLKDYKWPKDKIIYSIEYNGGDKKQIMEYKNNEDIDNVCAFFLKKNAEINFRFEDGLYFLRNKFTKDSQKCDFPVDKTGIKDIIIKTKSEEIKLEYLYHKKYAILFLELVDKAIKDNNLEYVKIIFSTREELDSKDKYKYCNK